MCCPGQTLGPDQWSQPEARFLQLKLSSFPSPRNFLPESAAQPTKTMSEFETRQILKLFLQKIIFIQSRFFWLRRNLQLKKVSQVAKKHNSTFFSKRVSLKRIVWAKKKVVQCRLVSTFAGKLLFEKKLFIQILGTSATFARETIYPI